MRELRSKSTGIIVTLGDDDAVDLGPDFEDAADKPDGRRKAKADD